jgi:porin
MVVRMFRAICVFVILCFAPPVAANETGGEGHTPPLTLDVSYTADIWHAADGGVREGTRYLDNLDIVAHADLEALVGWTGAEAQIYGLYNNGNSLNSLMGDAQVVSNIETGVPAFRLYEAWIDQKIGDKASVRMGLYDINSEFDNLDTSGLFIGSAHGIGTDVSQSGENGPSIFPSTSLAARVAMSPAKGWVLRAAVLDGVPGDPAHPKRTAIKIGHGDGALLIGELEAPLPRGKLLFGHWHYTARADAISGGGRYRSHGVYVRGEMRILSEPSDEAQGLNAFFRWGQADQTVNPFGDFLSGGLVYTGPFAGRGSDQIGLAVATAYTTPSYRLAQSAARSETVIELTYRAPLTQWLTLQPNAQYVLNPGADSALDHALAVGLRIELGWSF